MNTGNFTRTQRITVTMPGYLVQQLNHNIAKGDISSFVTRAVSDKLTDVTTKNAIDDFFALRKKFAKTKPVSTAAILRAIHKGRT